MTEKAAANPPKVSVVSITYNHEAYIREALDGFVAQKTDYFTQGAPPSPLQHAWSLGV